MKKTTLRQSALRLALVALAVLAPLGLRAQQTLPYSYGFENNDLSADGWVAQVSSSSSGIKSEAAKNGSYGFRFQYSENPGYLMSPIFTGNTSAVTVTFSYKEYSSSYGDEQFQVGYTTDETVTDPSAFTYGAVVTASTSWQDYEETFPAGTKRIAIKYIYNDAFYLYLDDFSFEAASDCTKPGEIVLGTIGATTASISWTAGGSETSWNVYLTQGGSPVTGYNPLVVNTTPNCTFSGLTASTVYDVAVEANCGGSVSNQRTSSFTTALCEATDQCEITIVLNDSYGDGWNGNKLQVVDVTTSLVLGEYTVSSGASASYTLNVCSGRDINFVYVASGNYQYENGWSITDVNDDVITEHTGGNSSDPATAGVITTYTPSCTPITCPKPTGLTLGTITESEAPLTWTAGGSETSWKVYLNDLTTPVATVNTDSYTFTGLSANTSYTFGVAAVCGVGDESIIATVSGNTACGAYTIPYTYGFETADDMACWNEVDCEQDGYNNLSGYLYSATSNPYARTEVGGCFGFSSYNGNTDPQYFISPELTGITNGLHVEFYYRSLQNNDDETFEVGYSTTDKATASFTWSSEITSSGPDYNRFSANYPAGVKYVAIKYTSADSYYLFIDDITFEEAASCLEPTAVEANNITTTSAEISWTAGASETAWDIYVTNDNTDVPDGTTTPTVAGTTDNPHTLTALTPATTYYVYVRAACSTTDQSAWSAPVTFHTECEGMDLPYGPYGFENGALTVCWNHFSDNLAYNSASVYNANAHTGDKSLRFYRGSTAGDLVLALPVVDDSYDLSDYQFEFYAYATETSMMLTIGIMDDPNDLTTFVAQGSEFNPASSYTEYKVRFNGYTGSGKYVAIKVTRQSGSSGSIYMDDIAINPIPSCIEPTALSVSDESAHGATFGWTSNGTESAWQLYISENTTAPADNETNVIAATSNPFTLTTGLDPETEYHVWVRAKCGTDSYSTWVGPETFTTGIACPAPTNLAVTNGSITAAGATITWEGTASNYIVMVGEEQVALNADFEDQQIPTTFTNDATYPWTVVANDHSGAYCAKSGNGAQNSTTSELVYNVTLTENATLTFSAKISSESSWDKGYFSIDGTNQYGLNGISGNGSWIDYSYQLTAGNHALRWYYSKDNSGASNDDCFYLDDIKIAVEPATMDETRQTAQTTYTFDDLDSEHSYVVKVKADCGSEGESQPSTSVSFTTAAACQTPDNLVANNITSENASISWNTYGQTGFNLRYSADNGTTWTTEDNVSTPYVLVNLTSNTAYQVQVQAACNTAEWSTVLNFTTKCDAITTFPITYGFETTEGFPANASTPTTNQLGNCWRNQATLQNGSNATRVWGTSTSYKHDGSQALILPDKGNSTNFAKTMLVFPAMEFTNANGYVVSFWIYRNGSSSTPEGFKVYASNSDTIDASAVELGHYSRNYNQAYPQTEAASGWYQYETAPIALTGTVYLIFEGQSYYGSATYVDDITIDETPTCLKPTALTVTNTETDEATLSWTENGSATAWQICLNGDETNLIAANTNPFTVTGLTPATDYTAKVRAYCSATDQSAWSNETNITTECAVISSVGYTQNFDSYTAGNNVLPICWSAINTTSYSTYQGYPKVYNYNYNSTPNCLYLYSYHSTSYDYDPQPQYAILPEMNDLSGKRITLQAKGYNASSTFKIGTMSDPTDATTFAEISEQALTTSYQEFYYDITSTTDHYIAIMIDAADATRTTNGVYIDDISINTTPSCEKPTNLQVTASGHEATATWESDVDNYEIAYATSSTADPEANIDGTATDETYTVNGLAIGDYYFWVRANCGTDGYSQWQGPVSVHIGYCTPNPTSHDGSGITGVSFGTGTDIVNNGDGSASLPASSPYYGDYTSMIGAVQAGVESTIAITTGTGSWPYTFVIWVDLDNSMTFEDDEVLYVGKAASGTGTLNATITIPATQALGDYRMRIYGADSYFSNFYNNGTTNWSADHDPCAAGTYRHAHDYTLRVLAAPSCMPAGNVTVDPANITANSAIITWTNNNGASATYTVKQGTTVLTTTAVDSYTLGGLTATTTYPAGTYTIVSNCDETVVANVPAFTTDCEAITTFPWSENFEGFTASTVPTCWDNSASTSSTLSNYPERIWGVYEYSSNKMIRMYNYYVDNGTALINTPSIELPTSGDYALSFDYAHNASCGNFTVKVSTDNGANFTDLASYSKGSGSSYTNPGDFTPATISLADYAGESIILQFFANANYGNGAIFVDNIKIDLVHTITATANPAAGGTITGAGDYTHGDIAELTATANDGYRFVNWTKGGEEVSTEASYSFNVTEAGDYVANFAQDSYNKENLQGNMWYAIASPVHNSGVDQTLAGVSRLTNDDYDLFGYNESEGKWQAPAILEQGKGYIYRHGDDATRTLTFTGVANSSVPAYTLSYACDDQDLKGFNLVGNPYPQAATPNMACYSLNTNGTWEAHPTYQVHVCEAVLVKAENDESSVTFTTGSGAKGVTSALAFTVSNEEFEDVAYARFDNGESLPKIGHLTAEAPMLSIPVDSRRYAIANLGNDCESFNLAFRGVAGQYTIAANCQLSTVNYLHLIDRATGRDIDLLRQSYTFSATGNDADRFTVKLSPDAIETTASHFAYWNGNSWVVEGNGKLQVIDAVGRQVLSQDVDSQTTLSNAQFPGTGVYILRMAGKVQKIVVK